MLLGPDKKLKAGGQRPGSGIEPGTRAAFHIYCCARDTVLTFKMTHIATLLRLLDLLDLLLLFLILLRCTRQCDLRFDDVRLFLILSFLVFFLAFIFTFFLVFIFAFAFLFFILSLAFIFIFFFIFAFVFVVCTRYPINVLLVRFVLKFTSLLLNITAERLCSPIKIRWIPSPVLGDAPSHGTIRE